MRLETDPAKIIKLLTKKGRASAADVGTSAKFMKILEETGAVKSDGTIKGRGRGRPPIAYVAVESFDGELPELIEPVEREGAGVSQAQIDAVIREVAESPFYNRNCSCIMKTGPGTTQQEIRDLNGGCTGGQWVCPALDAVRRRANLHNTPLPADLLEATDADLPRRAAS